MMTMHDDWERYLADRAQHGEHIARRRLHCAECAEFTTRIDEDADAFCICDLIARVGEDERERLAVKLEAHANQTLDNPDDPAVSLVRTAFMYAAAMVRDTP